MSPQAPAPILYLDHAPAIGGAEQSLLWLLDKLNKDQWTTHLAGVHGMLLDRASALGVQTHLLPMPRLRRSPTFPLDWLRTTSQIAQLTRSTKAAILHTNTVRATIYTALAARMTGIPLVWHMRDFWLSETAPSTLWIDRWGKRLLCASAAQIITNSNAVAEHIPYKQKISVVHNGVDLARFDASLDSSLTRQQYGVPLEAPVVGTVGRLRPWKGQDRFLQAFARLAQDLPQAFALVIGGNPLNANSDYAHRLRTLVQDLQIANRVIFTGHLDDVRPALAALDVFVHAGDPEPFGLVNLEAMAMRKPIVAFAHGALPEIVSASKTGILVPPYDLDGLHQALVTMFRNPEWVQTLGCAGYDRVKAHFDIHQTTQKITTIYHNILNQPRHP